MPGTGATATGGQDYEIIDGTFTITAGQTAPSSSMFLDILDENVDEDDKQTVKVTMALVGADKDGDGVYDDVDDLSTIGTSAEMEFTYTINDDDAAPNAYFKNVDGKNQSNKQNHNVKNENTQFVKKIKKNNHPNKIYQLPQSNSLKYKQLNEITSQIDQKTVDNKNLPLINNQISEASNNNKFNGNKFNNNQILNVQHSIQANNTGSNFSQQNDSSFSNSSYNSVLENFIDNLDLTQKGWTSKLTSRIEKAIQNGGEEIEFNLKPKNLGLLKVSVKFKNGVGNVKIVTENSFVTSALNQNENYLQKLFNEQGINLDFSAQNEGKKFDSRNNSNQNSQNNDKKNSTQSDINIKNSEDESDIIAKNNSSRHMINVIA